MGSGISYFDVLFVKCGAIGWLLWGLSVAALAIIVTYLLSIRRARLLPSEAVSEMRSIISRRRYHEAMERTAGGEDLLSCLLHAAMSESTRGYYAMERAMEEAADNRAASLLRKIEWLNLIGNIGPMLGLLGTVWGMILAFFTIVEKGGIPEPGVLAGAIGIALVTTLEGLMIAIPSLAIYAMLRNRIDSLTGEALVTCQKLISAFRSPRGGAFSPAGQERHPVGAET